MRIMVCGGAGFIGSHFIDYTIKNHPQDFVLCYDKLTYAGKMENIEHNLKRGNFAFVKGDICNKEQVINAVKNYKIDTVVNFAAESHVDRSIESSSEFLQTNIFGVDVLLQVTKELGLIRFHQISTDEVYGDVLLDSDELISESGDITPSSAYSASKASADLLVMAYKRTFNLPVSITRSSNNYGTRQHCEKLIPKTVMLAVKNSSIPIYGNGENIRDWLHVEDHCKGIDLVLRKGKMGEIYNVGANNFLSNLQLVKKILAILNKSEELITFVPDRLGHDLKYGIDCSKIKNELGFFASYPFNKGLEECVLQYLKEYEK